MSLAYRISAYNRRRKWNRFQKLFPLSPAHSVLDVGFSDEEYSATDNFLEKNYPFAERITALGVDAPHNFCQRYPQVRAVQYDGRDFPFVDGQFDLCWSNAVIEHVGSYDRQLHFLREIRRVSKTAYVTTPNRHFPIEVHTRTPLLHFLPKRLFERYLHWTGQSWATEDYMHLLSHKDLSRMLGEAGITDGQILGNRLGPFTLDFVLVWGQHAKQQAAELTEPAVAAR